MNGRDNAEIDYVLFNKKAQSLVRSVRAENYTDANTYDHITVTATLQLRILEKKIHAVKIKMKPKWEKCDVQL